MAAKLGGVHVSAICFLAGDISAGKISLIRTDEATPLSRAPSAPWFLDRFHLLSSILWCQGLGCRESLSMQLGSLFLLAF